MGFFYCSSRVQAQPSNHVYSLLVRRLACRTGTRQCGILRARVQNVLGFAAGRVLEGSGKHLAPNIAGARLRRENREKVFAAHGVRNASRNFSRRSRSVS